MDTERVIGMDYFQGMQPQEIEVIAGAMKEDAWWDGSVVVQQGDQKGSVYFVLEGTVRIERRQDNGEIVTVGMLGSGAVFGILGVLDGVPRAASCVAENAVPDHHLTGHQPMTRRSPPQHAVRERPYQGLPQAILPHLGPVGQFKSEIFE